MFGVDFGALLRKMGGDKSADVIKGVNVGNGIKQITTGKDYDVIDGISFRGGKRNPVGNAFVGRTAPARTFTPINTGGGGGGNTGGGGGGGNTGFYGGGDSGYTPYVAPQTYSYGGKTYYSQAEADAAEQEAKDAAERKELRGEISGYNGRAEKLFEDLFRRIKSVASDRRGKIDDTYNEQDAEYTKIFQAALPQIDNAFAALGIGNSTYAGDRIDGAAEEHKGSLKKSANNRKADLAEVGQWQEKELGAFNSDRQNINKAIGRSKDVEDLGELRRIRNNVDTTLTDVGGKKRAFTAGGDAVNKLNKATGRSKNFEDAMASLQGVLNSQMDVGVKRAAKDALVENAVLDDEERKKLSEVQINDAYSQPVKA